MHLKKGEILKRIILFDGVCNLCNGTVQFIIKRDPKALFQFAPLQSTYGNRFLEKIGKKQLEMFFIEEEKYYTKSTAVLKIFQHLSGAWPLCSVFLLVPRFLRDGVYNLIAKHRYQWFGRKKECMIPDPSIKDRFIAK